MYKTFTCLAAPAVLLASSLTFCGPAGAQSRQLDNINNIAGTIANLAGVAAALSGAVPPGPPGVVVVDKKVHLKGATSHRGHVAVHSGHH